MTCIGNSGDLAPEINEAISAADIVAAAVLSGNRNFEARIHPNIKANYLASPPLVVAYALAGRIDIDFENEPLGHGTNGVPVFLKDIWPSRTEISEVVGKNAYVLASFGDSITTDHISPAGNIAKNSPAARHLLKKGVQQADFNTYGARRGNDEIMARGTFANTRIINKLAPKVGPQTTYIPTGEVLDISDAALRY
ncbi:unnamed protein product [Sphagnum balticum]